MKYVTRWCLSACFFCMVSLVCESKGGLNVNVKLHFCKHVDRFIQITKGSTQQWALPKRWYIFHFGLQAAWGGKLWLKIASEITDEDTLTSFGIELGVGINEIQAIKNDKWRSGIKMQAFEVIKKFHDRTMWSDQEKRHKLRDALVEIGKGLAVQKYNLCNCKYNLSSYYNFNLTGLVYSFDYLPDNTYLLRVRHPNL